MSLISDMKSIKDELGVAQGRLDSDSATNVMLLRLELDAIWKVVEAIASTIDGDKDALGF